MQHMRSEEDNDHSDMLFDFQKQRTLFDPFETFDPFNVFNPFDVFKPFELFKPFDVFNLFKKNARK